MGRVQPFLHGGAAVPHAFGDGHPAHALRPVDGHRRRVRGAAQGAPKEKGLRITAGTLGRVVDYHIKDANHMGAAMAPAVRDCIRAHFADTGRKMGEDYDYIFTGDLGWIGREILLELLRRMRATRAPGTAD